MAIVTESHNKYGSPSRQQLRDTRKQREHLAAKFSGALDDLNHISLSQKSPQMHIDPMEHVSKLKEDATSIFSEVPKKWKTKARYTNKDIKAESRVRQLAQNPDFVAALKSRPHADDREAALGIVNHEKPLRLSWEAVRAKTGRRSAKKDQGRVSQLAGLFSQNATLNPDVEQGPAPSFNAPENSRRKVIAEKAEARKKLNIPVDPVNRKAKLYEVELKKPGKVSADFVPKCVDLTVKGPNKRQEVAAAREADADKMPGKVFR